MRKNLVGAAGFEPATPSPPVPQSPSPPVLEVCFDYATDNRSLACLFKLLSGLISGLAEFLRRYFNVVIRNMRVPCRGLDIAMVQRALHQLEIAGLPKELGSEVVPEIMKVEASDAGSGACSSPARLGATDRQRITCPQHPR
jgi:hypothetical protein